LAKNIGQQCFFVFSLPWKSSEDKFVKYYSKGPNVTFFCIRFSLEDLRGHIIRCSYMRSKHTILTCLKIFSHSEICKFIDPFIEENVCGLNISMNNIKIDHFFTTFEYLEHNLNGFLLSLCLIDTLHFEVRLAMFHYKVHTVLFIDYFKKLYNVVVIYIPHNVYLVL